MKLYNSYFIRYSSHIILSIFKKENTFICGNYEAIDLSSTMCKRDYRWYRSIRERLDRQLNNTEVYIDRNIQQAVEEMLVDLFFP